MELSSPSISGVPDHYQITLLTGQLWRISEDAILLNGKGNWRYKDYHRKKWTLPDEGEMGYVTDQGTNRVLGIDGDNNPGSNVSLQLKENPESLNQMWIKVSKDDGYFTLENPSSGLFLNNGQLFSWKPKHPTVESSYLFEFYIMIVPNTFLF